MPKYYIIAGESSGDSIGFYLMQQLQKIDPNAQFKIVGGNKMESLGFKSLFPIQDISIMGYVDVLLNIRNLMKRISETVADIIDFKPDALITIDSPGFNFRVVKKLRKHNLATKYINYVSPSIWAYKPQRANTVAKLFDHQLLILPNEKHYYDEIGFPSTFVGHPSIEMVEVDTPIKKESDLITVMPGSRISELNHHIPILKSTILLLEKELGYPLNVFVPTLPHTEKLVKDGFDMPNVQVSSDKKTINLMIAKSKIGLIKSGTSTIEILIQNLPMVTFFKTSKFNAFIAKRLINTPFIGLPNILSNRLIIPEFIQDEMTVENLSKSAKELMVNNEAVEAQLLNYKKVIRSLKTDESPSIKAAKTVMRILNG